MPMKLISFTSVSWNTPWQIKTSSSDLGKSWEKNITYSMQSSIFSSSLADVIFHVTCAQSGRMETGKQLWKDWTSDESTYLSYPFPVRHLWPTKCTAGSCFFLGCEIARFQFTKPRCHGRNQGGINTANVSLRSSSHVSHHMLEWTFFLWRVIIRKQVA